MIRQNDADGVWLFTQGAHAYLCGQFARAWRGSALEPADEMLYAIANHDAGWLERDREPQINGDGKPRTFTELDLDDHIAIWGRSIERVSNSNRYAGLMVSLHATTLYQKRLARGHDNPGERTKIQGFVDSWSATQEKIRLELAPHYGKLVESERLTHNLELLQALDWLSLMLCIGSARDGHSFPAGLNAPLTASVDAAGVLHINPWLFAEDALRLTVEGRYLNQKIFAADADLRDHYRDAPLTMRAFRAVPGG